MPLAKIIWTADRYVGEDDTTIRKYCDDLSWEELSDEDLAYLQAHLFHLVRPGDHTRYYRAHLIIHEPKILLKDAIARIRTERAEADKAEAKAREDRAKKEVERKRQKALQKAANERKEFEKLKAKFEPES